MNHRYYILILIASTLMVSSAGCNRAYYRRQADAAAYYLIGEKAKNPHWQLTNYTIETDPRSRMTSPFSQDHPPMPPDDPTSNQLMDWVDHKPGYPLWHANGDTHYVENPLWMAFLPLNEDGELEITESESVRIALMQSPVYQRQKEQLYISALDVSLERFAFDTQFFGGYDGFFTADGPNRPGGPSSDLDLSTSGWSMQKMGITGTTAVVNFANTLMWQFAGPDDYSGSSLIDFSIVQPLLRQAGRERVMEGLTESERTLLANVRSFERFRRDFYLEVTIGGNASFITNFLVLPAAFRRNAGGYLGLLQDRQNIFIDQFNVTAQKNFLRQLQDLQVAGRTDALQVSQTESSLYQSQIQLLGSRNQYQASLDFFKRTLGISPTIPMSLDDEMLKPLELLDADFQNRQNELSDIQVYVGDEINQINELSLSGFDTPGASVDEVRPLIDALDGEEDEEIIGVIPALELNWSDGLKKNLEEILRRLEEAQAIRDATSKTDIEAVDSDIDMMESSFGERERLINKMKEKYTSPQYAGQATVDAEIFDLSDLKKQPPLLREDVKKIDAGLNSVKTEFERRYGEIELLIEEGPSITDPKVLGDRVERIVVNSVPSLLTNLYNQMLELSLIQVQARTESVNLSEIDMDVDTAVSIASRYRRDWMNARAELVDQWRNIEFVANLLESDLDIVFDGDVRTVNDGPFNFRTDTGRLRVGFQFDAPLTRLAERNNYRESLIAFNRSRRDYYVYEDTIVRNFRDMIRTIEVTKLNFEIGRRQMRAAVAQVDQSYLDLVKPPDPGRGSQQTLNINISRNFIQAIQTLQNARRRFISDWVIYEVLRRSLDYDLGTMQLDDEGLWIDPGKIDASRADGIPYDCPTSPPGLFLTQGGAEPMPQVSSGDFEEIPQGDEYLLEEIEAGELSPAEEVPADGAPNPITPPLQLNGLMPAIPRPTQMDERGVGAFEINRGSRIGHRASAETEVKKTSFQQEGSTSSRKRYSTSPSVEAKQNRSQTVKNPLRR